MAERQLAFDVYRLNKVEEEEGLLSYMGQGIASDDDIVRVIQEAASDPQYDVVTHREKAATVYKWGLREYIEIQNDNISTGRICSVTLARSIVEQTGVIVTDDGFEVGTSTPDRELGVTISLIFFMDRHISAVQYKGTLMATQVWRASLHEILDKAAQKLDFTSSLRLEPVPRNAEVLATFNSFSLLTRLRLKLVVPNPDMTPEMESLTDEMRKGGVREWAQDMKNKKGLSQEKGNLPQVTAAIADRGYKNGPVTMEGQINGKEVKVVTGEKAERINVDPPNDLVDIKNLVIGMESLVESKEGKKMIKALKTEIDKRLEPPKAG